MMVRISVKNVEELRKLKVHPRESYDEIIGLLLRIEKNTRPKDGEIHGRQ